VKTPISNRQVGGRPGRPVWAVHLETCLDVAERDPDYLTPWERKFLISIDREHLLTDKQHKTLETIYAKVLKR